MDDRDRNLPRNGVSIRNSRAEVLEALERLTAAGARSAEQPLTAETLTRIAELGRGNSPD